MLGNQARTKILAGTVILCLAAALIGVGSARAAAPSTAELVEMAPYLGYLSAHKDVQTPFALLGGPIQVTVKQTAGGVHVALPDYRRLDPRVFNTPELPRAFAGTPIITGLPPADRGVANGKYTKATVLSPFGDKYMVMSNGRLSLDAMDVTATDAAVTQDTVDFTATWKDDAGHTYGVRCQHVIPHGVEYPVYGGVVTNTILHGSSRVGTPLMPTEYVYLAFWGMGETLKDDAVLTDDALVHVMLTELVRGENYTLDFDSQVQPIQLQAHLIVAPFMGKDGTFVPHTVKTGYALPDGKELPFWHVMFANLEIWSKRVTPPSGPSKPVEGSTIPAAQADPTKPAAVVDMTDSLKFVPEKVTITQGQTIEWKNVSGLDHTVTCDTELAKKAADVELPKGAKPFNSGLIKPGDTYEHTFTVPGTYKYFCIPHELLGMIGEVIVTPK